MTLWIGMVTLLAALATTGESPRSQYEALVDEFDTAHAAFIDAVNKAGSDEDRVKAEGQRHDRAIFRNAVPQPDLERKA